MNFRLLSELDEIKKNLEIANAKIQQLENGSGPGHKHNPDITSDERESFKPFEVNVRGMGINVARKLISSETIGAQLELSVLDEPVASVASYEPVASVASYEPVASVTSYEPVASMAVASLYSKEEFEMSAHCSAEKA